MNEGNYQGIKPPPTTPKPPIIVKGKGNTYKQAFIDGITCFAWWKDGIQYVGTAGTTLKKAIEEVEASWNYRG